VALTRPRLKVFNENVDLDLKKTIGTSIIFNREIAVL
jgi:hypothetical protein